MSNNGGKLSDLQTEIADLRYKYQSILEKTPATATAEAFVAFYEQPRRPVFDLYTSDKELQSYRLNIVKQLKDKQSLNKQFAAQLE